MQEIIEPGYMRVSEVISLLRSLKGINQKVLESKADLGTRVHGFIASYLNCIPQIVDEDCEGYFNSFIEWFRLVNPEPIFIEKRFYNEEEKLTGAIDCLFQMPDKKTLTIVDWKTTASVHEPSWGMQAALYNFLASEAAIRREIQYDIHPSALFIKLNKDGGMPMVKKYVIDSEMQEYAMALLTFKDYFDNPRDFLSDDLKDLSSAMISLANYLDRFSAAQIYNPYAK